MQKIIPRGQIEKLSHEKLPRIVFPRKDTVFQTRAIRFHQLAESGHVLSDYLILMGELSTVQHIALSKYTISRELPKFSSTKKNNALGIESESWKHDKTWFSIQNFILNNIENLSSKIPGNIITICKRLNTLMHDDFESFKKIVESMLIQNVSGEMGFTEATPFIMAALQVYWTSRTIICDINQLKKNQENREEGPFGICPFCGYLPVASQVCVGGIKENYRYLLCGLCSTKWHLVRVICSNCRDTSEITYYYIETGTQAIKAESCNKCNSYSKIFYQEKDPDLDIIADDLASLNLDLLMAEKGYLRSSRNPFLWIQ